MKKLLLALVFSATLFALNAPLSVEAVAHRIARLEGWNKPNSLVRRSHNPGALCFANQRGASNGGWYASFKTDTDGWNALYADINAKLWRGWSLDRILTTWSECPREYKRKFYAK